MTKDEQIEQLEMEKRVLIEQVVKAQHLLRRVAEELSWRRHPELESEVIALYERLRG